MNRAPYPFPPAAEEEDDAKKSEEERAQEMWAQHKRRGRGEFRLCDPKSKVFACRRSDSEIVDLFQFQIRSELECPACQNVSLDLVKPRVPEASGWGCLAKPCKVNRSSAVQGSQAMNPRGLACKSHLSSTAVAS